jgi:hypothetical protein
MMTVRTARILLEKPDFSEDPVFVADGFYDRYH